MNQDILEELNPIFDKIISLLNVVKNKGISTQDIAKKLNLDRHTLSKYLFILLAKGNVRLERNGKSNLWFPRPDLANIDVTIVHSGERNEFVLAKEIVNKIKDKVSNPKLLLVFSSTHINHKVFLKALRQDFSSNTKIAGCTTVGEFSSLGFTDEGVVALAFDSKSIDIGIGVGHNVCEDAFNAGRVAVRMALRDLELNSNWFKNKIYTSIENVLNSSNSFSFLFPEGFCSNEEEVLKGIINVLGTGSRVFGGSAGDNFKCDKSFQFVEDNVYTDSVLFIMFVSDVKVAFANEHGWIPSTKGAFVTKSCNRVVYELNNERASKVYAELLGKDESELFLEDQFSRQTGIEHPLGAPDINGEYWLRHPMTVNSDGSINFFSKVPQGVALNLTTGSRESLLEGTKRAVNNLKKSVESPAFAIVTNCVARRWFLGDSGCKEEIEILKKGLGCPFIGFYSMGEQTVSDMGVLGHKNQTINIAVVSKKLLD